MAMHVQFLNQPWDAQTQWFGYQLRDLLADSGSNFTEAYLVFAFVKRSGMARVYDALRLFTASGGLARAIVGLDEGGTTRQGVGMLIEAGVDVALFHDTSTNRTFHPKCCVFKNAERAILLIGSNNLTLGGLFSNYELALRVDLDLTNITDASLLSSFKMVFDQYWQSETTVQSLTEQRLAELVTNWPNLLPDENLLSRDERILHEPSLRQNEPPNPFRSLTFQGVPHPTYPPSLKPLGGAHYPATEYISSVDSTTEISGFWKVLSSFDVSTTSAPGQIIIPISYVSQFPELTQIIGIAPEGGGRTWEAELPVSFASVGNNLSLSANARIIRYEPRSTHARPNTELRFTFRNRQILEALQTGDILVFIHNPASTTWFDVQHLTTTDPRYTTIRNPRSRHFGEVTDELAHMLS